MAEMKEAAWSRLLAMMSEGSVVPVVGSRLLTEADGTTSLQSRVAQKVLAANGLEVAASSLPPFREVNEAVTLLKGKVDMQDLYGDICMALNDLRRQGVSIPRPIAQLAQISDFRLYVTLTPDEMLARALAAEKRAVSEVVHTPKPSKDQQTDLPAGWNRPGSPVQLLYLFGKARSTPQYAIHDEDTLEYAHNVIAGGDNKPRDFLAELHEKNLLLVGCNFPDWLSRFMLRATGKLRLADQDRRRGWLVEPLGGTDPFIGFLGRYSPSISVLSDIEPAQFIDELHRRWMDAHGGDAVDPGDGQRPPPAQEPPTPETAMFFISYSRSTDLPRALRLYEALKGLGVAHNEIWFDRETLEPADRFRQRIVDGIQTCRYFLPLVSRAATAREEAFVFIEWDEATKRLKGLNRTYLVPLVVDPENQPETYNQISVRAWRDEGFNFGHAPEGEPDRAVTELLTRLVRASRPNA